MPYGHIYRILNTQNGRSYVGQSVDVGSRLAYHEWEAFGRKSDKELYSEMREYGIEAFAYEVLDEAHSLEDLNQKEIEWGARCKALKDLGGYGLRLGMGNGRMSAETKQKIGAANRVSLLGKKQTAASNLKRSLSLKGRTLSAEHRQNLSKARAGKPNSCKGRVRPPEVGQKISVALRGKKLSEEHRQKISEARKGRPNPKSGASRKGRPLSAEHRAKLSESATAYWDGRKNK